MRPDDAVSAFIASAVVPSRLDYANSPFSVVAPIITFPVFNEIKARMQGWSS